MPRQQAEQVLRERRGKAYDPWIVDQFLRLLDRLEDMDAAEKKRTSPSHIGSTEPVPHQLDVISATTAEEREFNELRRELPRAATLAVATEALFKHVRRVIPVTTLALYLPQADTNELAVVACFGVGASAIEGMRVAIGDRISGWAFAHSQVVINSDAVLELGPVAKAFSSPLRYAAAVPIVDGSVVAVVMIYANDPFEKDHRRLAENAATLFASSVTLPIAAKTPIEGGPRDATTRTSVH
jgi:hypothetical protein